MEALFKARVSFRFVGLIAVRFEMDVFCNWSSDSARVLIWDVRMGGVLADRVSFVSLATAASFATASLHILTWAS